MNPTPKPMQDASEPRYTVEELLAHLYELAPDPYACEATRIDTVKCADELVDMVDWDKPNIQAHFESLKKGGPHGR